VDRMRRCYWRARAYRICEGVSRDSFSLWRAYLNSDRMDDDNVIDVRVRQIGDRVLRLRRHGDAHSVVDSFTNAWHVLPSEMVPQDASTILDLGANIGCTMAHFAWLYPHARILGVELDEQNAQLCSHNMLQWGDRCEVLRGAVWESDGTVRYERPGNYRTFKISMGGSGSTPAYSLNTIFEKHFRDCPVDYVKMDIEGAESAVLRRNTEWATKVKTISVEVHAPYVPSECCHDLKALGFEARIWNQWMAVATRSVSN
jgi:FkbM family methyltransferase